MSCINKKVKKKYRNVKLIVNRLMKTPCCVKGQFSSMSVTPGRLVIHRENNADLRWFLRELNETMDMEVFCNL